MAIVKAKPTSPGRRGVVQVKHPHLHKGAPYAGLVEKKSKSGGRNNTGRITTRHRGGGHKQHYRVIDFKRDKDGIAVHRTDRVRSQSHCAYRAGACMSMVNAATLSPPKAFVPVTR